jgi:hypothetical protein
VQRNESHFAVSGINITSVKYGNGSFLRAVGADADEYVSGKDIAADGNEIADS